MMEILQLPFMQRALIAGVLVSLVASFYGVFVVQRGLSFLGDGLAHAAFGGVALGLLLGVEPLWVALPFTALVAAGIVWIQNRAKLAGDTAIGIFFAVSIALGVIFLSMRKTYTQDAFSYLFGSLLAVRWADVGVIGAVALATPALWPLWSRWAYATFDRDMAEADRLSVERDDYLLAISIAVAVVMAVKIVGVVLIAAFLVIPAATARLTSRTFLGMTLTSATISLASVLGGICLSYVLDKPTGPVVILVQAAAFFALMPFKR